MAGLARFGGIFLTHAVSLIGAMTLPGASYGEAALGNSRWDFSVPTKTTGSAIARQFLQDEGTSGAIANGATYDIVLSGPAKRPILVSVFSSSNLNQMGLYLVQGDGAANITVNVLQANPNVAVASVGPLTIRVTNNYGLASVLKWSAVPLATGF